jgi:hypothetical protein
MGRDRRAERSASGAEQVEADLSRSAAPTQPRLSWPGLFCLFPQDVSSGSFDGPRSRHIGVDVWIHISFNVAATLEPFALPEIPMPGDSPKNPLPRPQGCPTGPHPAPGAALLHVFRVFRGATSLPGSLRWGQGYPGPSQANEAPGAFLRRFPDPFQIAASVLPKPRGRAQRIAASFALAKLMISFSLPIRPFP